MVFVGARARSADLRLALGIVWFGQTRDLAEELAVLLIQFHFGGDLAALFVNRIPFAYLRLDLLSVAARPALQERFRQYVDAWLAVYRKLPDMAAAKEELGKASRLQGEIWSQAVAACWEAPTPQATMLLLPALNAMLDITTTRTMATQMHPPLIIFALLFGLGLASALLAGYGMASAKARNWLHMFSFAAAMAIAVYVILDLEYPRLGWIRVDAFDQALVDLRESMR